MTTTLGPSLPPPPGLQPLLWRSTTPIIVLIITILHPSKDPKLPQWPRAECSWPGSRTRPPCRRSLPAARAATRCRTRRRSLKPDPRTRGSLNKAEGPRLECSGGGKRLPAALSRTFHFCLLASLLPATCSGMRVLRAAPWMLCCGDGLIISSSASIVFIAPDTDT